MEYFMEFNISMLTTQVLIIAIEVLGNVQLLKHFIRLRNGNSWKYAVVSLIITLICVGMNTKYIPPNVTYIFNMTALVTAAVQLAYDSILQGFNNFISKAMNSFNADASKINDAVKTAEAIKK
jgi:hypothetical protein